MTTIGVVASGRGSNFRALCEAERAGRLGGGHIAILVVNQPGAGALAIAGEYGVETVVLDHKAFPSREAHDLAVADALTRRGVQLVCHAGYMRIVGKAYLDRFPHAVLNIHPALLPAFGGRGLYGDRVHRAVLESGVKLSGCTVHFADACYDHGPIILQAAVPVYDDDTVESLAARVFAAECELYPQAIQLYAEDRLRLAGRRVRILPAAPS